MEKNSNSNKKFSFEGNLTAVRLWSIDDNLETLNETKKRLQEMVKKKWLTFYVTTVGMILIGYFSYKYQILIGVILIGILIFILYIQLKNLKRYKYQEIDLNLRIEEWEEKDDKLLEEIEDILLHSSEKIDIPEEMNMFRCKKCYSAGKQRIVCGLSVDGRKFQIWCDNCNRANLLFVKELKNL
ncbi:hypothetical protein EG359_22365 (plasmid) [Chryseobacterium joostei]|uniref:Uncharacterized protein n=1 Tax=Chryseobacterium joostei TaxID=112234 RepID=A0A1N7KGM5_9FLAO|nr:hypothetical protein [Chryseobacterium joostei]AZB02405.1 hypothetical protein EG359_22365 [Chryseobacterium joostei]SIS60723.1 hypothetical protein SAMN05421768_11220 [Chryseobacterium joostei]